MGKKEVVLTTKQMPSHTHEIDGPTTIGAFDSSYVHTKSNGGKYSISLGDNPPWDGKYSSFSIKKSGGDNNNKTEPFENRPPYYALAYIMKIR